MSKLVIISAPSGTGKSTIVNYIQENAKDLNLRFSISATSREPRGNEKDGIEYYFLTVDEFVEKIKRGDFVEYEEVYTGRFYGTLKSEVERIFANGDNVIFDVDCEGGINIKKIYSDRAISIFIKPPSIEALRERLIKRGTDSMEVIGERLAKAEKELSRAEMFDYCVENDNVEKCGNKIIARAEMFDYCVGNDNVEKSGGR